MAASPPADQNRGHRQLGVLVGHRAEGREDVRGRVRPGADDDEQQRVGLPALGHGGRGGGEGGRRGAGPQVHRVGRGGRGGGRHGEPRDRRRAQRRNPQAVALRGVRGQHVEAAGVAHDGEAVAGRQRLVGQHAGGVQQLAEAVGADHAGLLEQGVDRGGRGGRRGGVRRAGTLAGQGAPALDGQHRLAAGQGPHGTGELARIAEGLQVQRHRVGGRVVVPVRDEVVAADVGLVAQRHQGRDAGPVPGGALQHGDRHRAGLRGHREGAGAGRHGGEAGVEPHRLGGVEQPEAVRADQPDALRARRHQQVVLELPARRPVLAEARAQHDGAVHPDRAGLGEHVQDLVGGHRDDEQVDRRRKVADVAVRGDAVDRGAAAVDRVQPAGEAVGAQGQQRLAAHPAGVVPGAHDRHGRGGEDRVQGSPLRDPVPDVDGQLGGLVGAGGDPDVDDAVGEPGPDPAGEVAGHLEHPHVARQHLADQLGDAVVVGADRQLLQQQRADAPPALVLRHERRELRAPAAVAGALVRGDADGPAAQHGDDGDVPLVVGPQQPVHLGGHGGRPG
ncbi:hypothetical protein GCM10020358_29710 [Amorphoplanes nipponensis]